MQADPHSSTNTDIPEIREVLSRHATRLKSSHISQLFYLNPERFRDFHCSVGGILFDFSRQRMDEQTLSMLLELAVACDLPTEVARLFSGAPVNTTENRPALHWAQRLPPEQEFSTADEPVSRNIREQLDRMGEIVRLLHDGKWKGATGRRITDVVNIGVGGSGLGPLMSCRALDEFSEASGSPVNIHFVAGMDGTDIAELMDQLHPETTLFIISSKSFSTIDTLTNARTARHWLERRLGATDMLLRRHFVGVSAKPGRMSSWGIHPENQLLLGEWTGGRFSIWSPIGLPLALHIGMDNFRAFLDGGHMMDQHFATAPLADNLPVLMALITIWNTNFLDIPSTAFLPYDGRLDKLPDYLQQLEMESNGKSTTRNGTPVQGRTAPVLWGAVGHNAQHAFFQLLHQGTEMVACDFLACVHRFERGSRWNGSADLLHQHHLALANCLSQAGLLALGDRGSLSGEVAWPIHQQHPGNRPVSCVLLDELSPFNLGALLAAYEHKVFVQSVVWNLDAFDQWGVERGKKGALDILALLEHEHLPWSNLDASTEALLRHIRGNRPDT